MVFLVVYHVRTIHYERVLGYGNGIRCIYLVTFLYFMILKFMGHGIYLGTSRNTVVLLWYKNHCSNIVHIKLQWYHHLISSLYHHSQNM